MRAARILALLRFVDFLLGAMMVLRLALMMGMMGTAGVAQEAQPPVLVPRVPKPVPVPPFPKAKPAPPEPTSPPAQDVFDPLTRVRFHLPAGWNLSRRDGELSTFRLDARSATAQTRMREVAALGFNPYPWSTFSGAYFYVSATPRSTPEACAAQAKGKANRSEKAVVDDVGFDRGQDEHGQICVEARDEVLTAMRKGACVRFDLVITTFCAESSGARELMPGELGNLQDRLGKVLGSVKLGRK